MNTSGSEYKSNRMTSNSLSQQSNLTRQQSNNNPVSNAILDGVTHSNTDAIVQSYSNGAAAAPATMQIQLTDMPLEIFERIFQYTGYKEVSNMRLVRESFHSIIL